MDFIKFLSGCWLYAHDIADEFIKDTISEAKKKNAKERNLLEKFLLLSKEGEDELQRIPDLIGLATKKDIKAIEKKIDLLISKKGK